MIILITGASHSGKTILAQRLMERYHFPYMSIDHLKMGLIRSGHTDLTPLSGDGVLTAYLWPIVREMVKTAIENKQNLIIEGIYIPFSWQEDFETDYLKEIDYRCLILSEEYIRTHFDQIKARANIIENRLGDGGLCVDRLVEDNRYNLEKCKEYSLPYIYIEDVYEVDFDV